MEENQAIYMGAVDEHLRHVDHFKVRSLSRYLGCINGESLSNETLFMQVG